MLSDTPIEVMRQQAAILAKKTPQQRSSIAFSLIEYVLASSKRAILNATGGDELRAKVRFVELNYGRDLAVKFEEALRRRAEA